MHTIPLFQACSISVPLSPDLGHIWFHGRIVGEPGEEASAFSPVRHMYQLPHTCSIHTSTSLLLTSPPLLLSPPPPSSSPVLLLPSLLLPPPLLLPSPLPPGREHHELDILLFHEVLDHIARIDRVLTSPGGSLLLSGRSGVGRHTAVSLVAHMHQMEIITPHVSRNYHLKQFKNDLKNVSWQSHCGVLHQLCYILLVVIVSIPYLPPA